MNRLLVLLLLLTACSSDDDAASSAGTGGTSGTSGGSGGASGSGGEATGKGGTGATSAGTSGTTGHGGSMAAGAGKGGTGNGKGGAGGTSGTSGDAGAGADGGTSGTSGEPGAGTGPTGDARYFGDAHSGNFWLGPVDYAETEWHNACAPSVKYPPAIQSLYGDYIMGLANEVVLEGLKASDGQLCDTCVELTANGQTFVARAITFGQETGPNDIDVSPELDTALDGAASRSVTWRFTTCSTSEPVTYTFDGAQWDNVYFFRVWVRNARIPITKVEYRLGTGSWATADEQGDGAWQASNDDFSGGFSLRVTAIDGQTLEDDLPGLNTFDPNVGVASHANFQ